MNYREARDAVFAISDRLALSYDVGEPYMLAVHDKPRYEIRSFEPFAYKKIWGSKQAETIVGEFALRSLIISQRALGRGWVYYAGVSSPYAQRGFAVPMTDIAQMDSIAQLVCIPEISFQTNKHQYDRGA